MAQDLAQNQDQSLVQDQASNLPMSPNVSHTGAGVPSFCSLCNEIMNEKTPCLVIANCNHFFHQGCIEDHLATEGVCPICKSSCNLSELRSISYPMKQFAGRGRGRGAITKHYQTRSQGRDLQGADRLDGFIREDTMRRGTARQKPTPKKVPKAPDSLPTVTPTIDYSEISRLIESNITRVLRDLNLTSRDPMHSGSRHPYPNDDDANVPVDQGDVAQHISPQRSNSNFSSINHHTDRITSVIRNWGLTFDGLSTMNVEDFLYRLRILTNDNFNGDFTMICKHLPILLTGKAQSWFWRYHKQVGVITWDDFCDAIRFQYRDFKSTFDIREEMRNRKQKPGESFDSFYEAISTIMDRLPTPLSDMELIEIVTRNLRPDIRHELLYVPVNSIPHLRRLVQMRESLLNDEYMRRNFAARNANAIAPRRQISEIEVETGFIGNDISPEMEVNAMDTSNFVAKCWNCDQAGHHWQDCLEDRSIFCYGCGAKDTYKPKCPKCSARRSKNFTSHVPEREQA